MSKFSRSNSHFAVNPTRLDISRSVFNRKSELVTSFNAGDLVPLYCDEVLPGDTFKIDMSSLVRMSTPIHPTMDNLFADYYFFFVPSRIVWDHWEEFNGENKLSAWEQPTEYSVPQLTAPAGGWNNGTLADYFGIPTGVANISVNALPFRAYAMICNEWFRNENVQDAVNWSTNDSTVAGSNGTNPLVDVIKGGALYKVSKYHDYFTSALPQPQKGPSVLLPLGTSAPVSVYGTGKSLGLTDNTNNLGLLGISSNAAVSSRSSAFNQNVGYITSSSSNAAVNAALGVVTNPATSGITGTADLTNATAVTINQLRLAFQMQKLYERDARGGTRYTEILRSHFGVTSPDARLQRPEYLGGFHKPLNVMQVLQTSSTDSTSPQGNTAAFSLTSDVHSLLAKSFTEHGYVIGLVCVRANHTYQQGINRMWSRKSRFDFYWPVLANIGEQAILNKEIYAQGTSQDDEAFGYQEAWAEYRYKPSMVTGQMRSNYAQSLDSWHYADSYNALPTLTNAWMVEPTTNIDRTLAVQSSLSHQFIGNFAFNCKCARPMPVYSVPGLVDHH